MNRVCMMDLQFFIIRCVLFVHIMLVSPIRSQQLYGPKTQKSKTQKLHKSKCWKLHKHEMPKSSNTKVKWDQVHNYNLRSISKVMMRRSKLKSMEKLRYKKISQMNDKWSLMARNVKEVKKLKCLTSQKIRTFTRRTCRNLQELK